MSDQKAIIINNIISSVILRTDQLIHLGADHAEICKSRNRFAHPQNWKFANHLLEDSMFAALYIIQRRNPKPASLYKLEYCDNIILFR